MELNTTQISEFKTLVSCLKDILSDTNIVFTRAGVKIITIDKLKKTLVDLVLPADNFDTYSCESEKIVIAVDMVQFHKIIHGLEADDELTIKYSDGSEYLDFVFKNSNRNKQLSLKLIEADGSDSAVPNLVYSHISKIDSSEFKKCAKTLIADEVSIITKDKDLMFKSDGSYVTTSVSFSKVEYLETTNVEINQRFLLKSMSAFTKCCALSSTVTISQETKRPIIFMFEMEIGVLKLCLSPL